MSVLKTPSTSTSVRNHNQTSVCSISAPTTSRAIRHQTSSSWSLKCPTPACAMIAKTSARLMPAKG